MKLELAYTIEVRLNGRGALSCEDCHEETDAVPEQAEQAYQYLTPKECHCDEQLSTIFIPFTYAYGNTSTWWKDVVYACRWPVLDVH